MAILEGGPRTQATSRCPAPLGLTNPLKQNFHFLAFFEGLEFEHFTNVNLMTDSITNCTSVVKPKKPKNRLFGILLLTIPIPILNDY